VRPLVSVFLPERLELVKGPPALRRAHLDQFVAALWPARISARSSFRAALAQRNALLARFRGSAAVPQALDAWDAELARHALELMADRRAAVELVAERFAELATALGLAGEARVEYRPRSEARDVEAFVAELQARRAAELERGLGTHGPQRDELALLRDGRELRAYGSQGEQRLALLALLLAERALLAELTGEPPLMLLDDAMSELDGERRTRLAGELAGGGGQSVVTATDAGQVPAVPGARLRSVALAGGAVLQALAAA
jgi:DNA replication and repair protein RecF